MGPLNRLPGYRVALSLSFFSPLELDLHLYCLLLVVVMDGIVIFLMCKIDAKLDSTCCCKKKKAGIRLLQNTLVSDPIDLQGYWLQQCVRGAKNTPWLCPFFLEGKKCRSLFI